MPSATETVTTEAAKGSPAAAPATKETEPKAPAAQAAVPPKPPAPEAAASTDQKPPAEKPKGKTILTQATEDAEKKPAEEGKPAAEGEQKTADAANTGDEIKLILPDNSRLDPTDVEQTLAFAKDHGLTQKQAEAALHRQHVAVQSHHERLVKNHETQVGGWAEELKNDPEFGGEKFIENSKDANLAMKTFFPDLAEELDVTGFGNHPKLVKGLSKLGKLIKSDKTVFGGKKVVTELSQEKILFGPDGK